VHPDPHRSADRRRRGALTDARAGQFHRGVALVGGRLLALDGQRAGQRWPRDAAKNVPLTIGKSRVSTLGTPGGTAGVRPPPGDERSHR
jgi:hypothetical protein